MDDAPDAPGAPPRRPTLADVAAAAGVSRALVSIVVRGAPGASEETRARVLAAAEALGYRPDTRARLLRASRTRLLGVVFGVAQPFHGDLVDGLYVAADRAGYALALSATTAHRDEQAAVSSLLDDRCEALLLLGPRSPARDLGDLARTVPVVVVARSVRDPRVDVVRGADDDGVEQAVDHLVALGHRRLAHVDGGRAPAAAERRRGFRAALARHGLADGTADGPADGPAHGLVVSGGTSEEDGAAAARRLLAEPDPPTGVTVFNDRCALGVLDVLRRAGRRVPEDVSVVGYDDSRLARLAHVDLTSVDQDAPRLAELAVGRAADRLAGVRGLRREVVVAPRLVVRSTTAPREPATGSPSP